MRNHLFAAVCAAALAATCASAQDNALQDGETWDFLKEAVSGALDATLDPALLSLDAPSRASDPAHVPLRLTQSPDAARIATAAVIVDENPAPIAAEFEFGPAMHPLDLEMRVRVNAYSNVRTVALAEDGTSVMAGRYVKASGGCSAPAGKDPLAMLAQMGQTRFQLIRSEDVDGRLRREVKLMIRHPNYSGLQRDQVTLLTIPVHIIDLLEVRQGEELLFRMTAGISLSEDPVFQFSYFDTGNGPIVLHAEDTKGNVWEQRFELTDS